MISHALFMHNFFLKYYQITYTRWSHTGHQIVSWLHWHLWKINRLSFFSATVMKGRHAQQKGEYPSLPHIHFRSWLPCTRNFI